MTKFKRIVEAALKQVEYAKLIAYIEKNTQALYNWITTLNASPLQQNFNTIIDNIPIYVLLVDNNYQIIGYNLDDKSIYIALDSLNNFNKKKLRLAVEHEFMHAYHDLVLHLPIKKEYINLLDQKELERYYNSEEEFNTYSEEILYFLITTTNSVLPSSTNKEKLMYAKKIKVGLFNSAKFKLPLDYIAFINSLTLDRFRELDNYLEQELEYYYMENNNDR